MKGHTTRYDSAVPWTMPWTWLESAGALFALFIVFGVVIAVFTRLRERAWNVDTVVNGRRVKITALASIWPCVAVDVDAVVPRSELRARRRLVRDSEQTLHKIVRVSHVECGKDSVRVVVRPLPFDVRDYDLQRDVVPYVIALERAARSDAEGSAGGSPVAVPASGSASGSASGLAGPR
jgi:hypothetical protein